jgi:Flp pilus assembly protein TadD
VRPHIAIVGSILASITAVTALAVQVGNTAQSRAYAALADARFADAATDARRARTWTPWASEPLRVLGDAQLALGRRTDARSTFAAALRKDPNDWRLWYDLARVTAGADRATALAKALRLNPFEPELLAFRDRVAIEQVAG